MNNCNCNKKDCCGGCEPARYDCDFNVLPDPYNDSKVDIIVNGALKRTSIPVKETDTKLSTDTVANTLNYSAERHSDILTGKQLGRIIELGDLSDVQMDEGLTGSCYELIYRKYGDCGEGCVSPVDAWSNFNINSDGAKKDYLRYVRGANAYGCPVYLDVPSNTNQYWLAGWKQDGEHKEFGYYQPEYDDLPKDALGNYIVASIDPNTKKPVYGPLPLDCILNNIIGNLGVDVFGTWSVIQETPGFTSEFNNITGDFKINWNDWITTTTPYTHVGAGEVNGRVIWTSQFNPANGHMEYHVTSVHFNKVFWTVDQGAGQLGPIKLTIKGVAIPSGEETTLLDAYSFTGNESWEQILDTDIPCDQIISVAPGQTVGPFNYAYLWLDWTGDDEGYTQVNFRSRLNGWNQC